MYEWRVVGMEKSKFSTWASLKLLYDLAICQRLAFMVKNMCTHHNRGGVYSTSDMEECNIEESKNNIFTKP
jgi:hypothetical protein